MAQIAKPKLPNAKLGWVKNKYFYVQTYVHHYDKEKHRSVRDSQKTIGKVLGGSKYGVVQFKEDFLEEHPELNNFVTYWTEKGFDFKPADEEELSVITEKPLEKKLAGGSWALQKLMAQSGIGNALKQTFGQYHRDLKFASLIIYMILKQTNVMHNYAPFSRITWLPWAGTLNDSQINNLFKSVTEHDVMNFFKHLNAGYYRQYGEKFYKNMFVALDSTSISTYSALADSEWGHNKDGDRLPQINYLMICDEASGFPIYGKVYKGNVVDVDTVKTLLRELKIMYNYARKSNEEEFTPNLIFTTDRGYDSEDNLQSFLINNYGFCMRSTLKSRWVLDEVLEHMDELKDYDSYDIFTSQHMFTSTAEYFYDAYPVAGKNKRNKDCAKIYVHMYFDENIYNSNCSNLKTNTANARDAYNRAVKNLYESKKTALEAALAEGSEVKKEKYEVTAEDLKAVNIGKEQYFIDKFCKFDGKGFAMIDSEAIKEKLKLDGIKVILSNTVDDARMADFSYERRGVVEANFQIFKDLLNFNRVYSSNNKSFQGKFLCQFIAAALIIILRGRIKDYEKSPAAHEDKIRLSNRSCSRLLDELQTIMLTIYKDGYFFDVINGKYKTLFNAIGVELPQEKHKYDSSKADLDGCDPDVDSGYEVQSEETRILDEEI